MKKTTVVIDEVLLEEATAAVGAKSKREAIDAALRTVVRMHNRGNLRKELGTFEIELTLEELESLRNAQ